MRDGKNEDVIGLLDVKHRIRKRLAKMPPHGRGNDAIKARAGAYFGDQPVDLIIKPAGERFASSR